MQEKKLPEAFSSPTSAVSSEETRVLTEYIHQKNLFRVTRKDETLRKPVMLKQFFKMKRHQQVVVSSVINENVTVTTEGKVSTIGRDFVMITDLRKRIWIPYPAIESATIPFGFPTYSDSQQHFIYDNHLQQKLVLQFGDTVAKREELVRQFFEESLQTNLHSWKGLWVEVRTSKKTCYGKIKNTTKKELFLKLFNKEKAIKLSELQYVSTVRWFAIWRNLLVKKGR
ncbi:hypothetical protein JSQ81_08495 [Sporosarcina sp. Marseille-Q4063]|uniref:hypothetical protein n=1 Tax=Sporosarcina sp. Marseille-Q4063 TaxID=2810514 RepID=UPI001BAFD462|nr:hypothetical protein [Sporosarcina sp. Marseille-Q4063]QUW23524.1 hypothetical protein JSQ81_08495 [Sporosarcina sp. Marseille-Q4063]